MKRRTIQNHSQKPPSNGRNFILQRKAGISIDLEQDRFAAAVYIWRKSVVTTVRVDEICPGLLIALYLWFVWGRDVFIYICVLDLLVCESHIVRR